MAIYTIVLGNKNYSSWSLRGWLMTRLADLDCDEIVIPMFRQGYQDEVRRHSPSGLMPVLKHDDLVVWDSLAIGEYLAERFPKADMWPDERVARAQARSMAAEMHSGFQAMRAHLPMNVRSRFSGREIPADVQKDINRITALWRDCRERYGEAGDYLFGAPTIADAMYAPVATRFRTYGIELDETSAAYVETILSMPAMKAWIEAAENEPYMIDQYEF